MSQKEQKATLQDFRVYKFNTLVATCIGEEGLDIPDVDLIVCLDVSASPTRSVQRTGRTGRHRKGRVVYVLSQGKEEQKYRDGLKVLPLTNFTTPLRAALGDACMSAAQAGSCIGV
jgi:ERCC4-related helicase